MPIAIVPAKELGEKYAATIWNTTLEEGLYGPQLKVLLAELNGNIVPLYMSVPATPKNRLGRNLTSLLGTYPQGTFDEETLIGMTVDMVYAQKKGGEPGDLVLDLLKPRKPGKDEDPTELVTRLQKQDSDASSDPF